MLRFSLRSRNCTQTLSVKGGNRSDRSKQTDRRKEDVKMKSSSVLLKLSEDGRLERGSHFFLSVICKDILQCSRSETKSSGFMMLAILPFFERNELERVLLAGVGRLCTL